MFSGDLKKATHIAFERSQYQPFEIVEELTTDIDLKSCHSNIGSPSMPRSEAISKNAQTAAANHGVGMAKFLGVTSAGNLGLAANTSANKLVGRTTVTSIGSEEDDSKRDTLGKQSAAGHAPSIESRERDDPIPRGRSSSKQSKSSWESKKHHPRVANSAARLMFDMTGAKPSSTLANLLPGVPFHAKNIYDDKLAPARYRDSSEGVSGRKDPVRPMSGFAALQTVKSNRNLPIKKKAEVPERNLQMLMGLINSNPSFAIPDRPVGNVIVLTLYTNWGDPEHLGLNAIEFFDGSGVKINFPKPQESISSPNSQSYSVHLSPEYLSRLIRPEIWKPNSDQLFISKLEDGNPLQIKIKFKDPQRLTFIRIWNYDKSKTHASRGVRHLSISLGTQLIFFGEIKKSSGDRSQFLEDAEYICFLPGSNRSADAGFAADWVNSVSEADFNPPHTDYNETYRAGELAGFLRGTSGSREPSESIRGTVSSTSGSPRARGSLHGDTRGSHPLGGWNGLQMLERKGLHRNTASGYEFSLVPTLAEEVSISSPGRPELIDQLEFTFFYAWFRAPSFALKAIELLGSE